MASINTSNQLSTFIVPENLKIKAVSISFIAAFITGGFGAILGLVSPQISSHYHVNVSHIVYIDVLNILGLLIGNALSSKTMSSLGCKYLINCLDNRPYRSIYHSSRISFIYLCFVRSFKWYLCRLFSSCC